MPSQNWLADCGKTLILPFSPTGEGTSLRPKLERDERAPASFHSLPLRETHAEAAVRGRERIDVTAPLHRT